MVADTGRLRTAQPDYLMLGLVVGLVVVGLLVVYSSSFALGLLAFDDANYFVFRQAIWAFIGLVAMVVLMRLDYRLLRAISPLLMPANSCWLSCWTASRVVRSCCNW